MIARFSLSEGGGDEVHPSYIPILAQFENLGELVKNTILAQFENLGELVKNTIFVA